MRMVHLIVLLFGIWLLPFFCCSIESFKCAAGCLLCVCFTSGLLIFSSLGRCCCRFVLSESASHMCCIYVLCACCVVDKLQKYTEKPKRQPTLTHTHTHTHQRHKQKLLLLMHIEHTFFVYYAYPLSISLTLALCWAFHSVTPFGRVRCALCLEFSVHTMYVYTHQNNNSPVQLFFSLVDSKPESTRGEKKHRMYVWESEFNVINGEEQEQFDNFTRFVERFSSVWGCY